MRLRRLKSTTRFNIVQEMLGAAESGQGMTLSPMQLLNLCAMLSDYPGKKSGLYLEALVRQLGGRAHIDTRYLQQSTGDDWETAGDRQVGHGAVVQIASEEVAVESLR